MNWFGESWGAPVCEPASRVETPVGTRCARCGERFEAREAGLRVPFLSAPGARAPHLDYHRMCLAALILPIVCHTIRGGVPPCGFSSDVPAKWPHLHYWSDKRSQVTCENCARYMDSEKGGRP